MNLAKVDGSSADLAAIARQGQSVIAAEAAALRALSEGLDAHFAEAVLLLQRTRGRVVTCGLGKSGLIAEKIAATLRAGGTPACFLHAGDAIHGDLGLLSPDDTLVVLSNSGSTRELGAVLGRAAQLSVPMVAITSSPDSIVARTATLRLLLPRQAEVCPLGTSPTTSTTMMLALGDALAMTLMALRGTTAADLKCLHPGGRLGLDLCAVDSFMHRGDALPLAPVEAPMEEVLALICAKGFGIAGVVDENRRLLGVITDGDVRRHALRLPAARAGDVMTRTPRTLVAGALVRDALTLMSSARITALFVLDESEAARVVGLVHVHDLLHLGIG